MNTNLIIDLQNRLVKWLTLVGWSDWSHISQACNSLADGKIDLGSYPEYTLFMPLWRNGIVEVAHYEKRVGFSVVWVRGTPLCEKKLNSLQMLRKIPALIKLIQLNEIVNENVLSTNSTNLLKYEYSFKDYKFIGVAHKFDSNSCGIFKSENVIYYPSMILHNKVLYKIKRYQENPDAMNVAKCFVRMQNSAYLKKKNLFSYMKKEKMLYCERYSEIPILVSRALICSDISQLNEDEYYIPPSTDNSWMYRNISTSVIAELKRIFGEYAVEML